MEMATMVFQYLLAVVAGAADSFRFTVADTGGKMASVGAEDKAAVKCFLMPEKDVSVENNKYSCVRKKAPIWALRYRTL